MKSIGMNLRGRTLSVKEAKEIDMVNYLSALGYEPVKIRNADYWYLSPLRKERTASFKVNRRMNRWFDFGVGRGGSIIDFGIQYYDCSISELLQKLARDFSSRPPVTYDLKCSVKEATGGKIKVLQDFMISSFPLLRYLEQRGIPTETAEAFCREVRFELNAKIYYGIGFKNDAGGYEIRNRYLKLSSFPKDITTVDKGAKEISVFEGFFDFLSFIAYSRNNPSEREDYLVLNSLSFFEKARPFMEQHEAIRLYLDRDTSGQNCSQNALAISKQYSDKSGLFCGYKDLNEWWVKTGRKGAGSNG